MPKLGKSYKIKRTTEERLGGPGLIRPTVWEMRYGRFSYIPLPIPEDVVTSSRSDYAYVRDSKGDLITI